MLVGPAQDLRGSHRLATFVLPHELRTTLPADVGQRGQDVEQRGRIVVPQIVTSQTPPVGWLAKPELLAQPGVIPLAVLRLVPESPGRGDEQPLVPLVLPEISLDHLDPRPAVPSQ